MDTISKCIFLSVNVLISIKISLKFVTKDSINNIPALIQMLNSQQVIIGPKDDTGYLRIYPEVGLNELITRITVHFMVMFP